jgi:hypothetical protein
MTATPTYARPPSEAATLLAKLGMVFPCQQQLPTVASVATVVGVAESLGMAVPVLTHPAAAGVRQLVGEADVEGHGRDAWLRREG